jgi:membrane protease YdiL (CAAX protease family)
MRLQKTGVFLIVLASGVSIVSGLSAMNAGDSPAAACRLMIQRFVVALVFAAMGMFVAHKSQIKSSLIIASEEWPTAFRDFFNFGILPGLVLGLVLYLFFFPYRYSQDLAPQVRGIRGVYDAFILSLASGLTEEVIYRLFILSASLFFLKQLYARLSPLWPAAVTIIPGALALILSSLMFALVHNVYNFPATFFAGMLLGVIYLYGGIESAIAAHFAADFLFFSASYLS